MNEVLLSGSDFCLDMEVFSLLKALCVVDVADADRCLRQGVRTLQSPIGRKVVSALFMCSQGSLSASVSKLLTQFRRDLNRQAASLFTPEFARVLLSEIPEKGEIAYGTMPLFDWFREWANGNQGRFTQYMRSLLLAVAFPQEPQSEKAVVYSKVHCHVAGEILRVHGVNILEGRVGNPHTWLVNLYMCSPDQPHCFNLILDMQRILNICSVTLVQGKGEIASSKVYTWKVPPQAESGYQLLRDHIVSQRYDHNDYCLLRSLYDEREADLVSLAGALWEDVLGAYARGKRVIDARDLHFHVEGHLGSAAGTIRYFMPVNRYPEFLAVGIKPSRIDSRFHYYVPYYFSPTRMDRFLANDYRACTLSGHYGDEFMQSLVNLIALHKLFCSNPAAGEKNPLGMRDLSVGYDDIQTLLR